MLPAGFSSLVASTELDPVPTLAGLRLLSGRGIMNASKHDICGCMQSPLPVCVASRTCKSPSISSTEEDHVLSSVAWPPSA